jgi:hypothetical protein
LSAELVPLDIMLRRVCAPTDQLLVDAYSGCASIYLFWQVCQTMIPCSRAADLNRTSRAFDTITADSSSVFEANVTDVVHIIEVGFVEGLVAFGGWLFCSFCVYLVAGKVLQTVGFNFSFSGLYRWCLGRTGNGRQDAELAAGAAEVAGANPSAAVRQPNASIQRLCARLGPVNNNIPAGVAAARAAPVVAPAADDVYANPRAGPSGVQVRRPPRFD